MELIKLEQQVNECIDMLKRFHGLPPYNGSSNTSKYDPFIRKQMEEEFSREIIDKAKYILFNNIKITITPNVENDFTFEITNHHDTKEYFTTSNKKLIRRIIHKWLKEWLDE